MAENDAELKLLLDIRDAVTKLAEFEGKWGSAAKSTAAGGKEASAGVNVLGTSIAELGLKLSAVAIGIEAMRGIKAIFSEAGEQLHASVEAAGAAQLATAKLEAVIKATGNTVGLSTDALLELATAEQRVTGASDEEVQGVERLLIASQKLSGDALPKVIKQSFDLASQMEGGSAAAATLLAKAYGEPERAVEILRRSGILLGKDLDVTITKLVSSGHTAEAQATLFKALDGVIGGLAETAGSTMPGALARLDQAVDDSREKIGAGLAVEVQRLAERLEEFVVTHGADLERVGAAAGNFASRAVDDFSSVLDALDKYGIKLEEVPQLLNPLTAGAQVQQIAFRSLASAVGLGEESTVKLTSKVHTLATSLEILKAAQNAEAEAARANAAAEQAAADAKEIAAAKGLAKEIESETKARISLYDTIAGNQGTLDKESANLVAVIERIREHGDVTKAQQAKIKEAVQAQAKDYEEYGLKVPSYLQAVIQELGILTAAQQKAKGAADDFVDSQTKALENKIKAGQAADAPGIAAVGDAQGRVNAIKAEVEALEAQNDSATVTLEQSEALATKKDELKRAEQDLNRATLDNVNALNSQGDAAEIATNQMAELANQLNLAHGEIDEFGNTINRSNPDLLAAAQNLGGLGDATAVNTEATSAFTGEVDRNAEALAGLADRQRENNLQADAMGDAYDRAGVAVEGTGKKAETAGEAIKNALGDANADAKAYEDIMIRLGDSHLPKIVRLVREWKTEQSAAAAGAP